jgi:hypothetical protein
VIRAMVDRSRGWLLLRRPGPATALLQARATGQPGLAGGAP